MKFLDALRAGPAAQRNYSFQNWIDLYQNSWQQFGGQWPGFQMTYGKNPAEPIGPGFADFVVGGLQSNGVIFSLEQKRIQIFSQVRYQFQSFNNGRPGKLFPKPNLALLEHPWPGGTTSDLNARMLVDADFAGNSFLVAHEDEIIRLRPDWTEIVLEARMLPLGPDGEDVQVGYRQVGLLYYEGGAFAGAKPAVYVPGEYSHFAPMPDPLATYRGMSWLTPVIREIQADIQATKHKLKFFENAATPNLAVSLPKEITPAQFEAFVEKMDADHRGADQAYKTLYTGGGADVTVIGQNMQQLDFKVTQGAGETRLAAAAGIHPVIVGLSEGMQGSSLNAGNYNSAKRSTVDTTFRHLWQNSAGSLEQLVKPPDPVSRLWYDARDVPFLHEDQKDIAEIQQLQSSAVNTLIAIGYKPDAAVSYVENNDLDALVGQHSGLFSVQLQPPGSGSTAATQTVAPGDQAPPANRSRSVTRKFNAGELRDENGKWTDGPGGAVAGAAADALKLAGRIELGGDEKLQASGKLSPRYGGGSLAWAAIDSPRGREIRLAVLPHEDADRWRAANKGATASLSPRATAHLRDDLDEAQAKAKTAAKTADAQWADGAPTDPVLLGSKPVAEGRIASPWGDIRYDVHLTDDDPVSYVTQISVGDASSEDVSLQPKELAKFLKELAGLSDAPSS